MLYRHFHDQGEVPIYFNSTRVPPRGERIYGFLEGLFAEQYGPGNVDAYQQLDRSLRVIIVDDYDLLPIRTRQKRELVAQLSRFAGRLIILSHSLAADLNDLFNPSGLSGAENNLKHFRIQQFGHVGRNRIIEKWMMLDDDNDFDSLAFAHKLTSVHRVINTIVGRNFVPAYPIYLLAVLQATEEMTPVDISASTNGYFYELFIKSALARGRNRFEYDIISAYLAHISYAVFDSGDKFFTEEQFRQMHAAYEKTYDMSLSFSPMKDQLLAGC